MQRDARDVAGCGNGLQRDELPGSRDGGLLPAQRHVRREDRGPVRGDARDVAGCWNGLQRHELPGAGHRRVLPAQRHVRREDRGPVRGDARDVAGCRNGVQRHELPGAGHRRVLPAQWRVHGDAGEPVRRVPWNVPGRGNGVQRHELPGALAGSLLPAQPPLHEPDRGAVRRGPWDVHGWGVVQQPDVPVRGPARNREPCSEGPGSYRALFVAPRFTPGRECCAMEGPGRTPGAGSRGSLAASWIGPAAPRTSATPGSRGRDAARRRPRCRPRGSRMR